MKENVLLCLFFVLLSRWGNAQTYDIKSIKDVFIDDYKEVPDSAIVFPIRGFFLVSEKSNYGAPMYALEYFVLDAKGKLLYYNIYNLTGEPGIKDLEYARYMKLQGMYLCKVKN